MEEGLLILTTVGTSALEPGKLDRLRLCDLWRNVEFDLSRLSSDDLQHRDWVENASGLSRAMKGFIDTYVQRINDDFAVDDEAIREEIKRAEKGATTALSAEFTSLYLLNPASERDQITLLLSDSREGVISGLINKSLIKARFSIDPEIHVIEGLQPKNFSNFFGTGLLEFQKSIEKEIEDHQDLSPRLNITGGFKSLVPYATYIAFAHDISLYLAFEEQPEAISINLSQLKLDFDDRRKINDAKEVMRRKGSPPGYSEHTGLGSR